MTDFNHRYYNSGFYSFKGMKIFKFIGILLAMPPCTKRNRFNTCKALMILCILKYRIIKSVNKPAALCKLTLPASFSKN